ncbi:MAG: hypothetical protein JRI31_01760 [Deltaproteobacteria bacterium]|nr:hypothetical protein [Deltaproteobacteria bacterium]
MTTISGVGIHSIGDGRFIYDGREVSFEDMVFMVQMEVINRVDEQFAAKFNEIKERNKKIKDINDILAMLRKYQNYFNKDGEWIGPDDLKSKYKSSTGKDVGLMKDEDKSKWLEFYREYCQTGIVDDPGISWDCAFSKADIDGFMENAKAAISNLNAENELDMMVLNRLGNQRNSYLQLMKSLLEKISQARSEAARL